jgi:hypothetical protein
VLVTVVNQELDDCLFITQAEHVASQRIFANQKETILTAMQLKTLQSSFGRHLTMEKTIPLSVRNIGCPLDTLLLAHGRSIGLNWKFMLIQTKKLGDALGSAVKHRCWVAA